ncbi:MULTISPECIES: glucose 1-dehydrogenase [unclassified Sphingomonas]|uniref:glucose 1-dehydrogenase n=1 Tax=unclassified Sphingomonas TaxID=196159 RepID=UPI000BD560C0|nr:MAG: short-chain dehydrogenase [Sphingomonas sp. 12-62-6]OYX36917.1 MAG: short-chain dehydrogenase [Sphingomonas sp. 32-62-10]
MTDFIARHRRLVGKITLVTGAARGIGAAIVRAFVAEGATVWITDIDGDEGAALANEIGGNTRFLPLDVGDEAAWESVMAALLARDGRLDVLVNNAGITGFEDATGPHDPEHATLAEWHRVHRVNLDGTFLGCRYAIRAMRAQGTGAIINMSSRSGLVGIPGAAAYASSKAAVRNHTKSVALWCAQQGMQVRCNSVHPAAILTGIWEPMLGDGPDRAERMIALTSDTPLKRFGLPEEVAAMTVFLASDEATYITGSEFDIDGGLLAGSAASPG